MVTAHKKYPSPIVTKNKITNFLTDKKNYIYTFYLMRKLAYISVFFCRA